MRVTWIGGPTVLVELDGWSILVDPTFDAPGRRYPFAAGTSSVKTLGPAVDAAELGPLDAILVSHDHHADNMDDAGRALLPGAAHVVTTSSGARRLGAANVHGLSAGQRVVLSRPGLPSLEIEATPCRHGPPLSRPIVGEVIGFAIRRPGESQVALWVSGDSVRYRGIRRTARELDVDVAVINAGGVRFGITGPIRYSMTGADVVKLLEELSPRVAIPAHFNGWSHFLDGEAGLQAALAAAAPAVRSRVRLLPPGVPTEL